MSYIASLLVVTVVHFLLCYPAAVSRGYPPMAPSWEFIAIYLAFLGPVISPVFDDFSDMPKLRFVILCGFAVTAAVILAVPLANFDSAVPRTGSLAGYFGVWRYGAVMITFHAVKVSVVAIPFVICLESIARTAWNRVRVLPDTTSCS